MLDSNYHINFRARNKEIRVADDLVRRVNRLYPRVSSSAFSHSNYSSDFPRLMNNLWMRYNNVWDHLYRRKYGEEGVSATAEKLCDVIDAYRHGNCGEATCLTHLFARIKGIKDTTAKALYDGAGKDLNHILLLVNAKKPYIIDPWLGFADYLPQAFERYNKEFRNRFDFTTERFSKLVLRDYNPIPMRNLQKEASAEELEELKNIYDRQPIEFMDENFSGWIDIKSQKQDPKNYRSNVHRLRMLLNLYVPREKYKIAKQLKDENYQIYVEKGNAKLFVKYDRGTVIDIQDLYAKSNIPIKYVEILDEHIEDKKLNLSEEICEKMNSARIMYSNLKEIKEKIGNDVIECADAERILPHFGIKVTKDSSGNLTITHYNQPDNDYTFEDLGIDENKMFRNIVKIEGNGIFTKSSLASLYNCESIGGKAVFTDSLIVDLDNLKYIGANANFQKSRVKNLGKLEQVGYSKKDAYVFIANSPLIINNFVNVNVNGVVLDVPCNRD